MFSFFKRGKSKDDGDKKEKSKEKLSFSPFSKRQDSVKKPPSASTQEQTTIVFDSRFSSELTSSQVPKTVTVQEHITSDNSETQNTKSLAQSSSTESFRTEPEIHPMLASSFAKDEHDYSLPLCDLSTLAEAARGSPPISDEDHWRVESAPCEVFERAGSNGSSDRTESDSAFKTAPNTPVLSKHLTSVYSDVLIDSPELVSETPQLLPELPQQTVPESANFVQDPLIEVKKPLQLVLESLQEIKDPVQLVEVHKERLQLDTEKTQNLKETNIVNAEYLPILHGPQGLETEPIQTLSDSTDPLGANFDFPSADGEDTSEHEREHFCEGSRQFEECCSTDQCPSESLPEPVSLNKEGDQCAKMSQSPGELYDIVEEETSEDEEQSEEEREVDDDDDEDSGNVTQPTIEEEYPEEIFK